MPVPVFVNAYRCAYELRERALPQAQRHVAHGAHVDRHVLARRAVAARGGAHEHAVLIGERDGAAVDLQLADERHLATKRLFRALRSRPGHKFE